MNNKAVSAVIGIILMVSITVAIAATVYVYVSGTIIFTEDTEYIHITGTFEGISENGSILLNGSWISLGFFDEDNYIYLLGKNVTFILSDHAGYDYRFEGITIP